MTDYQTVNDEERSEQDQTFLDADEQTTETTGQEQQNQEQPNTPKEAWDLAIAQMTAEEARDYAQRRAYAAASGFPIPPPPGYEEPAPARVDAAAQREQDAQTAKDLESRIAEAQKAGEWHKSLALKHELTNLVRKQREPKTATTWGTQGPIR